MAGRSFMTSIASPEADIHDESPTLKRRTMREYEEKVKNYTGGGIENSHGKTWFRGRMIRQGRQGSVYLTEPKTTVPNDSEIPSPMVVKSATMAHSSSIQREKIVLSVLNGSPNLVSCYGDEITETESGEKIYNLLTEYCSGGSLQDRINKSKNGLPEAEVINYARDIARGLDYMHSKGYCHCDIKPDNILLASVEPSSSETQKYEAKIADLGFSLKLFEGDEHCTGIRGTLGYMAPEMLRDREINWPVDIRSFGCTVLEMLTGEPACGPEIMDQGEQEVLHYIGYSSEMPIIPNYISQKAKDFLKKCFTPDSGYDRLPASELLKHPFLSQKSTITAHRSSRKI